MFPVIVVLTFILLIALIVEQSNKKKKKTPAAAFIVTEKILEDNIRFYRDLDQAGKLRFKKETADFLNDVTITGVKIPVTDVDRIMVAASAIIPVFCFPGSKYPNLHEVLLYADAINMQFQSEGNNNRDILGMVGSGYMEGKMLLSQPALALGFSNRSDKHNTAIHEFVHLIDKSDGETDGIPKLLLDKQYVLPWLDLVHKEMEKIKEGESDIDAYGYTNKSEFFAVAAEYFFERPDLFKTKHPELFSMLEKIFTPALSK